MESFLHLGSAARGILSNQSKGRFIRSSSKQAKQNKIKSTKLNMNTTNTNSPDFDYCEWLTSEPTNKEEFLTVWQQFTAAEKAAVLQDFAEWLEGESDPNEWEWAALQESGGSYPYISD